MKTQAHSRRWILALGAACAVAMMAVPQAQSATLVGQLGILDLDANGGINPGTGNPWQVGDTYHLLFVTTNTTDALSTNIADYNAFVQAEATAAGMGSVNWFALGSTTTTNASANVIITGPVMNAWNSATIATDAADMWDFQFTQNRTDLAGNLRNVWTGSTLGGIGDTNDQLGAVSGTTRRHWSGWTDWVAANNNQPNSSQQYMIGISQALTVMPEPSTGLLIGLGGILALLRRRR